jgi:8-oxo-dGTP pyrophosphatase MutT (NUDIX family)
MKTYSADRSEQRKKWKREFSAGGIVFKKQDGQDFVLLIQGFAKDNSAPSGKWSFPKGWVGDHGEETTEQSALREVREEGGVNAKIIKKVGDSKYTFKWEGENVFKIVSWYLMEYVDGDPKDHDKEVSVAQWVEADKVLEMLAFSTDKEIFKKALKEYAG